MKVYSTDEGHVFKLEADDSALIFTPEEGFQLIIPNREQAEYIPEPELFLAAVHLRTDEEDWVSDLITETLAEMPRMDS